MREMPIHDWTKVTSGTFHAFHTAWIGEFQRTLNSGLLPAEYYAMAEQVATQIIPDVLTLQDLSGEVVKEEGDPGSLNDDDGSVAVAVAPPMVALHDTATEAMLLAARRRRLVIRHT